MLDEPILLDLLIHSEASGSVTLLPGVSEPLLDRVPEGLRRLAHRTAGFTHNSKRKSKWVGWDGPIRWDGDRGSDYLQDADSDLWHMDLGQDDCGNRWVLLLEPQSGSPREVLWASHDAPVTLIADDSFNEFCRRIIDETESFLDHIGDCEHAIWKLKPQGISVEEALGPTDLVIRQMAGGLDNSWRIFDARPGQKLRGFPRLAIDGIRKHSTEPVFALKASNVSRPRRFWKLW